MITHYSTDLKVLISKSRDTAIDMGHDYISTIHFFLADCEIDKPSSLVELFFPDRVDFGSFKKKLMSKEINYLNFVDESIPISKEAEIAFRQAESIRANYKQSELYPCHFFVAALENPYSTLFAHVGHKKTASDLVEFYNKTYEFEKAKEKIQTGSSNKSFLSNLFKSFAKGT